MSFAFIRRFARWRACSDIEHLVPYGRDWRDGRACGRDAARGDNHWNGHDLSREISEFQSLAAIGIVTWHGKQRLTKMGL